MRYQALKSSPYRFGIQRVKDSGDFSHQGTQGGGLFGHESGVNCHRRLLFTEQESEYRAPNGPLTSLEVY